MHAKAVLCGTLRTATIKEIDLMSRSFKLGLAFRAYVLLNGAIF